MKTKLFLIISFFLYACEKQEDKGGDPLSQKSEESSLKTYQLFHEITCIDQDDRQNILVGTVTDMLVLYKDSDKFSKFWTRDYFGESQINSFPSIQGIVPEQDTLWIVSSYRFPILIAKDLYQEYIKETYTSSLQRSPSGELWLARYNNSFSSKTGSMDVCRNKVWEQYAPLGISREKTQMRCFSFAASGSMWVGTDDGIWSFDPVMQTWQEFTLLPKEPNPTTGSVIFNVVQSICVDGDQHLWFSLKGQGLWLYNQKDTVRQAVTANGLPDISVTSLFWDGSLLWAATPKGAAYYTQNKWNFFTLLGTKNVKIIKKLNGYLWFCCVDGTIVRYKKPGG